MIFRVVDKNVCLLKTEKISINTLVQDVRYIKPHSTENHKFFIGWSTINYA